MLLIYVSYMSVSCMLMALVSDVRQDKRVWDYAY